MIHGYTFKNSMFHGSESEKKESGKKEDGMKVWPRRMERKKRRRLADLRLHSRFRGSRIRPELRSLGLIVTQF